MPDDHIPPRYEQTRPGDGDPGSRSLSSGTQSCPWSQPQTDLASETYAWEEKQCVRQRGKIYKYINAMLFCLTPDQKGAEEDEWDKVAVSKVGPTASLMVWRHGEGGDGGVWLTLLTW